MAKTAEATRARAGAQDMKSVDLRKVLPPLSQVRPRFIRQSVSQSVSKVKKEQRGDRERGGQNRTGQDRTKSKEIGGV